MRVVVITTPPNGLTRAHVAEMVNLSTVRLVEEIGHRAPLCMMDRINRVDEDKGIVLLEIAEEERFTYTKYAFVVAPLS